MNTQQGSEDFLQLILQNKGILIKICSSFCKHKTDREDLAQEIIYHLWKGNKSFNPDFTFSTWMYRVALNVAISSSRREKKLSSTIVYTEVHLEIEDAPSASPAAEEHSRLLQQQLLELKELDKALILLYFEEKSYKEIAEIIGISETNVATKVSRIKERLKQRLLTNKK